MTSATSSIAALVKDLRGSTNFESNKVYATVTDVRKSNSQSFKVPSDQLKFLLKAFSDHSIKLLTRRWIGLLLLEIVKKGPHIAETFNKLPVKELKQVAVLVKEDVSADIAFLAGRLAQALLNSGGSEEVLLDESRTGFEPPSFPREDSSQWFTEFEYFRSPNARKLSPKGWPTHIQTSTNKLSVQSGNLFLVVTESHCTVIDGTSSPKFVDISLQACSAFGIQETQVTGSPVKTPGKVWQLELAMNPAILHIDAIEEQAKWAKIGFRNRAEAQATLDAIEDAKARLPVKKSTFATSGRLSHAIAQDQSNKKHNGDQLAKSETPIKRVYDQDFPSAGKLKPVPNKRLRAMTDISDDVEDDDADTTFRIPESGKSKGKTTKSETKAASKVPSKPTAKVAAGRKKPTRQSAALQDPAADGNNADADPQPPTAASRKKSTGKPATLDDSMAPTTDADEGSQLEPAQVFESTTKKPQIVEFTSNGPRNQPSPERQQKPLSAVKATEPRVDRDGFQVPAIPQRQVKTPPRPAADPHIKRAKATSSASQQSPKMLASGPTAHEDRSETTLNTHNTTSSAAKPMLEQDDTKPMSASHVFDSPEVPLPRHKEAPAADLPSQAAAASTPDDAIVVSDDTHDESSEHDPDAVGGDDSVAQAPNRATPVAAEQHEETAGAENQDDGSSEDELSADQQRSLSTPEVGTGSQLSRRVNQQGSPFNAQTTLPLGEYEVHPVIEQMRAMPAAMPTISAKNGQSSARWSGDDETLVADDLADHQNQALSDIPNGTQPKSAASRAQGNNPMTRPNKQPRITKRHYIQQQASSPSPSHQRDASVPSSPEERLPVAEKLDKDELDSSSWHQQGMLKTLAEISQQLLAQVNDHEVAAAAVARSYVEGGTKLLDKMSEQHSQEAKRTTHNLGAARTNLVTVMNEHARVATSNRKRVEATLAQLSNQHTRTQQVLDSRIASIDQMLQMSPLPHRKSNKNNAASVSNLFCTP